MEGKRRVNWESVEGVFVCCCDIWWNYLVLTHVMVCMSQYIGDFLSCSFLGAMVQASCIGNEKAYSWQAIVIVSTFKCFFFLFFILVQRSLDSVQVSKFCKFLGLAV